MVPAGWLMVFLLFLGAELFFKSLTSLWFAAGALGAWLGAWAGLSLERQLLLFALLSFLVLFLIRPLAFLAAAGRRRAVRALDRVYIK